jgi:predicted ferric reductase
VVATNLFLTFAAPNAHLIWYVVRASGVIAYVLLTATVLAGLAISGKALPNGQPRGDANEIHSFAALLSLGFASIHGVGLLLDSYIGFGPLQVLVPFTSAYRPVAVAAGILGFYLMAIVYLSFWARKRIGYQAWRKLHYASFGSFLFAGAHGIVSGTDTGEVWMLGIYVVSLASVFGLLGYRIQQAGTSEGRSRSTARRGAEPSRII